MKGRYNGCVMNVYCTMPGYKRLASLPKLSKKARQRLKWFDYYDSHNHNARLTSRYFGISPQAFYRWKRRYDPYHLERLEDRSCRPRMVRQPTYSAELVAAVERLRQEYPRWGKDKLVILLRRKGFACSASTVGRILKKLKERGVLNEPLPNHISARKSQRQRPYAVRKPKDYLAKEPGDIVEVDTLDVRPLPGLVLKHFTARDVISRWDILEAHTRASSHTAAAFIDTLLKRMPFPVKVIQVDGGSEFQDAFKEECQRREIKLFVLPPRSPKLNGHVERAQRTHTEEFYEVTQTSFEIADLTQALLGWEIIYNTVRPHQALGYLTPQEFLKLHQQNKGKEEVSLRY
ncbi:MAG: integrase core domain-containing protein [Dehalococcoidia bacterium]|nr:integrase core domain-containing protein [Dehalococcoidia bacterium]